MFDHNKKAEAKKSKILTSTPYKDQIEENVKPTKSVKRKVFDEKPLSKNKTIYKGKKVRAKKIKVEKTCTQASDGEGGTGICPGCGNTYSDPPELDLIQCATCLDWWHEVCTSYTTGTFICDICSYVCALSDMSTL